MAAYKLGHYYLQKNQDSAKKYLHLAKELDYLRFRAPEKINQLIINLAKKYNCSLVDMEAIFLSYSDEKIIGDRLLSEHVHPNIKGYFIMADAFYNKIKELNFLNKWDNFIPFDEAINDIPITKIDSLKGKFIIEDLKNSWPYNLNMSGAKPLSTYFSISNPNYDERQAIAIYTSQKSWKMTMSESYKKYKYNSEFKKALHVAQSAILEYPEQAELYPMAADMCLKLNDFEKAIYYFEKFNKLEKSSISAKYLAETYIKLNKIELAKKTLINAKKNNNSDEGINKMLKELDQK